MCAVIVVNEEDNAREAEERELFEEKTTRRRVGDKNICKNGAGFAGSYKLQMKADSVCFMSAS